MNNQLTKKITHVEIVILLILIFVWIMTLYLMNVQKQHYIDRVISVQEKVLALAKGQLTHITAPHDIYWPLDGVSSYLVLTGDTIVASSIPHLPEKDSTMHEVFGKYDHASEMFKKLRFSSEGTDWIRLDKVTPRQWISWGKEGLYTVVIMSDENTILGISGYQGYKLLLLICACLFSALLLLALIWALSWMRMSAVRDLLENSRENG